MLILVVLFLLLLHFHFVGCGWRQAGEESCDGGLLLVIINIITTQQHARARHSVGLHALQAVALLAKGSQALLGGLYERATLCRHSAGSVGSGVPLNALGVLLASSSAARVVALTSSCSPSLSEWRLAWVMADRMDYGKRTRGR
jgi:hypothetical protein